MKIWLLRHGEKGKYTGDVAKIPLTEKGVRQADLLGKRLACENIDIIYSSTMTRAMQTADGINKYLNVRIEYRDGLKETDLGDFDRMGWDYLLANYAAFSRELESSDWDMPYPNGENGADVWKRAAPVIDEIISSGYENAAVTAHAGTIGIIICGAIGIPMSKRQRFVKELEHCGISRLTYRDGRFYLSMFNDFTHLGTEV
jgi:broad specificity phosphatase PhoE